MRENVARCIECGDYTDRMVRCPECKSLVCEGCLGSHLQEYHGNDRGARERDDDRY